MNSNMTNLGIYDCCFIGHGKDDAGIVGVNNIAGMNDKSTVGTSFCTWCRAMAHEKFRIWSTRAELFCREAESALESMDYTHTRQIRRVFGTCGGHVISRLIKKSEHVGTPKYFE